MSTDANPQYLDLSHLTTEQVENLKKAIREMPNQPLKILPLSQDLQVLHIGEVTMVRKFECGRCKTIFAVDVAADYSGVPMPLCPICQWHSSEELGMEEIHVPTQRHD